MNATFDSVVLQQQQENFERLQPGIAYAIDRIEAEATRRDKTEGSNNLTSKHFRSIAAFLRQELSAI